MLVEEYRDYKIYKIGSEYFAHGILNGSDITMRWPSLEMAKGSVDNIYKYHGKDNKRWER